MTISRRGVAVVTAAVGAVGFWSLKPVLITLIEADAGYVEAYLLAAVSALAGSASVAAIRWRDVWPVVRHGGIPGAGWSALSGVFLAGWYFGFYRALMTAPKVEATIIGFTWPLIAVVAMRVFAPAVGDRLTLREIGLIVVAFVGAAAVTVGSGGGGEGVAGGLLWAGIAALGSGLYLPFAVKGSRAYAGSGPLLWATFCSISVANLAALTVVAATVPVQDYSLDWTSVSLFTLGVCATIGVGTYLVAEIAWTWAVQAHNSLTLASLPYLSPAVTVLLLFAAFSVPVRTVAIAGLLTVLAANLLLHFGGSAREDA